MVYEVLSDFYSAYSHKSHFIISIEYVTDFPKNAKYVLYYAVVYLDNSLDVVHNHGGFHCHTRHTHGKTSLPLKVIHLLKTET